MNGSGLHLNYLEKEESIILIIHLKEVPNIKILIICL